MSNTIGPPATGVGWDEAAPVAATDPHGNACYEIQDLRMGLRIRLGKEHTAPSVSSAGCEHKQGSAVCWIQTSAPTTRPDGTTSLTSADLGRVWVDTTNNVVKVLTAIGTPNTWTPIGQLLLATYAGGSEPARGLYMKGNELYFKGVDGVEKLIGGLVDEDDMASDSATKAPSQQSVKAHVASGTVTMTNKTLTSPVLNTGVSGTAVLDEDNMASNSATKLATQQSIKAYVDAQAPLAGVAFAVGNQANTVNLTLGAGTWTVVAWGQIRSGNIPANTLRIKGTVVASGADWPDQEGTDTACLMGALADVAGSQTITIDMTSSGDGATYCHIFAFAIRTA
jgi:hypothetical protein